MSRSGWILETESQLVLGYPAAAAFQSILRSDPDSPTHGRQPSLFLVTTLLVHGLYQIRSCCETGHNFVPLPTSCCPSQSIYKYAANAPARTMTAAGAAIAIRLAAPVLVGLAVAAVLEAVPLAPAALEAPEAPELAALEDTAAAPPVLSVPPTAAFPLGP